MPKKKNLDLAAELGEEVDVTEAEANDAATIVVAEPPPAPIASSAPISLSMADLQALVATAVGAASQGNQNLAEIVTQGIAQARKPIPEGTDQSNPRVSEANPLGDRDHPRPLLKCEFYLGTTDPNGRVQRTYPYENNDLTVREILALNTLEPGHYKIALHDGSEIKVSVVRELDGASDAVRRMVIILPTNVTEKKSQIKNMLPGPCNLVYQMMGGSDFARLSLDDLAWFMAEHRAKRYVSRREPVAA